MKPMSIKQRASARINERKNIDNIWDLVERFIVPWRAMLFQDKNNEGQIDWRNRELYDPTAINANNNLAAHIHGALTNPAVKWFAYQFKDSSVGENQEAMEWLQECDLRNYQSIQESNFDLEANELYLDLTSFGNGSMSSLPEETPEGALRETVYKTFPVDECYYDFDTRGNIINFYRILQWTAIQIVDKFGYDSVPEVVKKDYDSETRSTNRHKLVFCIYKKDVPAINPFQTVAPKNRPYGSKYVLWADASQLGEEGGHHEMPVFAPRWRRTSGSQWGFSPSMIAIWDVLTLNQLVDLIMVAGEKVLDPTIMTTRKGVFGDIDLSAGGTVVVQDIDKSMRAFESRARFDVSSLQKQELMRNIEKTYFVDELQLKESPAMTATEVNARIQLMQRLLGPTFGRLQTDFLDPLVSRQFMINYRYGLLPPMPPALAQMGAELKIEYLGSLAKAQRMQQVESINRWVGTAAQLKEVFPTITDNVDGDAVIRELAEQDGIPAKLMVSKTDRDQKRKAQAEQAQKLADAQMQQEAGAGMEAMGKGREAINGGAETAGSERAGAGTGQGLKNRAR